MAEPRRTQPANTCRRVPAMILDTHQAAGAGFIAGTLVHTDTGLVPIEKLRVGDRVLSQSEIEGELLAYQRVVKTSAFDDKDVYLLMFATQDKVDQLVVTDNHPFWVKGKGWVQASMVCTGDDLALPDGTSAVIFCVEPVFRTAKPNTGWIKGKFGRYNDFTGDIVHIDGDHITFGEEGVRNDGLTSGKGYQRLKMAVFDIEVEVEDFHTCYVGEMGLWVHTNNGGGEGVKPENPNIDLRGRDYSTNKLAVQGREPVITFDRSGNATRVENPVFNQLAEDPKPALDMAHEFKTTNDYIQELTNECFAGDTVVHMERGTFCEIQFISVGDKVLSRCEKTGETAYREVVKKFEHEDIIPFPIH